MNKLEKKVKQLEHSETRMEDIWLKRRGESSKEVRENDQTFIRWECRWVLDPGVINQEDAIQLGKKFNWETEGKWLINTVI